MKFLALLAIIVCLATISSKKSNTKDKANIRASGRLKKGKNKKQFNPAAQLSNVVGPNSFTYGYGTSDNTLANYVGLQDASIMEKIPIHLNPTFPYTGVTTEANGNVSGNKLYYDGRDNLNAVHIQCSTFTTNPQSCVHSSKCGWCGQTSKCIPANIRGPLAPCLRSTFMFTSPGPFWNPVTAGDINIVSIDKKRIPQTLVTSPPDNIKDVPVYQPYY